ncbi:short-subunit dehydrogenase [Deinobacterium chartae]|uniref:Short-subunit dehydrogenase n=1 Tax=Deinobacterium chartae TaxID=521158 RepID=A0A841HZQ1_9DEIO|nr:SDR family NAD(P)-dependent oxidoreductase [Deinobacterium chartae]MBB6097215.1 short-subunit dehydrogenase [Deinobacterium chartae]
MTHLPPPGPHVILTGASSGIGEATARELVGRGYRVTLAARRLERLEALRRELDTAGDRVLIVRCDVTLESDRLDLLAQARRVFGPVGVLINNAGVDSGGRRYWEQPESVSKVLETNLLAAIELSGLVLPEMLERRYGRLIHVGSVAGRIGISTLYAASKFGLRGFSLALRRELLGSGVTSSLVAPGFVRTEMTARHPFPMPGPEPVARAVARLIARPRAEVVVPGSYHAVIALAHLFPGIVDFAARRVR